MKNERFQLVGGHTLAWKDRTVDLHNNFDFDRLDYSVKNETISLSWRRSSGNWVSADDPEIIRIVFTRLFFIKIETTTCNGPSAPSTLEYGGYLRVEDVAIMSGFLELNEVHGDYHYIFGFEGGMTIKIGALSGDVETNKNGRGSSCSHL